jgi:hypothetical protein
MSREIADFVKAHRAKHFPKGVKDPVDEKKSGDVGGYDLGIRDPESDKLAKKHVRVIHGSREGNKNPKDGVKDSLDDPRNKRLKGHGRNEKGDPMYESEEEMDEAAGYDYNSKSMKDTTYFPKLDPVNRKKTSRDSGFTTAGDLKTKMKVKRQDKKEVKESNECPTETNGHPKVELDREFKHKKGKKLLLGGKLKEDTLANQIAMAYLEKRLEERSMISGQHDVGCGTPDYTAGMEVNKKPQGELQTDAKPITGKKEKSKKQNYKYGEVSKKD